MPSPTTLPIRLWLCLFLACAGCRTGRKGLSPSPDAAVVPPHVAGTVAEYAGLAGGGNLPVRGFGVVVGLGTKGSPQVPPQIQKYLVEYLSRKKLGWHQYGTADISPERFLQDLDTAVVDVYAAIPPGAPEGTRFDVFVSAMPQTQTASLDGGMLMPTDLAVSQGQPIEPSGQLNIWGEGAGAVFVNPFADPANPADAPKLRTGRIIGGGIVKRSRPVILQLRQGDYHRADTIQKQINLRFRKGQLGQKVANARTDSVVEVTIPRAEWSDYEHFLNLMLHLPLRTDPAEAETQAREVAQAMEAPNARQEELALVLEAMGREIVPVLRRLYTSKNPHAAFHAAVAGMRLEDVPARDVLIQLATASRSPLQVPAIRELGRYRQVVPAITALRNLIDDENELVRLAAYESLLRLGDHSLITRVSIPRQFDLHLVTSQRGYVTYATQTMEPRIVLFGRNMPVVRPVFYGGPDDLVLINARPGDQHLTVFRKLPRTDRYSAEFRVPFQVSALVETLGTLPTPEESGEVRGLGLTYSQVVSTLQRLCKDGDIPAKFVLQPLPDVRRIYEGAMSVGRPDMPE